ncbi:MAG: ferredoxin--nitrite reductase [Candidatus Omnitrophica bacterium CG11_big_fil_rev_8_21_14_0_20_63_9]|nr:MAG: ferredoxin--nitrite reductase [Candidatus Omnitrophica bacterium CG11_big_fil_rev_8_21_14_0_20_63_9]
MRPGNNPIETYKASKEGDGLRIREDLPRLVAGGYDALTPADKELLKWIGVFFRKPTPGKFMMRIRMPNGFATSEQLTTIADLSQGVGNGTVDITTRQQLELRGYALESVPQILETLRGVNLRSLQTGMDNIRNLNGCPMAGLTPHELLDASPIVLELDHRIVGTDGNPEFTNLPRKLNVTVTGCLENCTHAESQDIALVPATAVLDGVSRAGFHVLVGGKMGSGGFTIAPNLGWFIEPHQAADVVIEIIKLFRDEGPRDARPKCRLAFLVEAWGLGRFRTALASRLGWQPHPAGQDARRSEHNDHVGVHPQQQPGRYAVGLNVTVGRMSYQAVRELARLSQVYGTGDVRLTTGQKAILINVPQERLSRLLEEPFLKECSPEPSRFMRGLVSCTGVQYCNLAVIETKARAVEVAKSLERRLGPDGQPLTIYWSGCPAACGNHQAADIGLRGMKVNIAGRSVDAVAIYVGGRTGPHAKEGTQIMEMVPCDEALPDVLATVVKHLELFKRVEPLRLGEKDRILMVPASQDPADETVEPPCAGQRAEAPVAHTPAEARSVKHQLCRVSELRDNSGRLVTVNGKSLAVFASGGKIIACDAECPHEGGPLQEGWIEEGCVVCPWHAYKFDLTDGRGITDPGMNLKTYPTVVEDGTVWVEGVGA